MQRIGRLHQSSWVHTRLPDQLPAALLITNLDRELALNAIRRVAHSFQGEFKSGEDLDFTLSGIAAMPEVLAGRVIDGLCSAQGASEALEPLLLFDDLPGREGWLRRLGQGVQLDAWNQLTGTVAKTLWHQSQEATDTRWARVLFQVATGQHRVPDEHFRWLTQYPDEGDQALVRPFIRASEINENPLHDYSARDRWTESFWVQCLKRTPCGNVLRHASQAPSMAVSRAQVLGVLRKLSELALSTATTSRPDARHCASFGLVAYALNVLVELFGIGAAQGILGRLGLRAIFEAFATMKYLTTQDNPALWEAYREYGQGQAKLAMLKADEFVDPPSFVSPELLEELAFEDKAPHFLQINLGHWANLDLRKLSETSGCKEEYDRIYPWTSAFVHANWAGVRAASVSICGNPLHRLHTVIQPAGNALGDVIDEAGNLVDGMFSCLAKLYSVALPSLAVGDHAAADARR